MLAIQRYKILHCKEKSTIPYNGRHCVAIMEDVKSSTSTRVYFTEGAVHSMIILTTHLHPVYISDAEERTHV